MTKKQITNKYQIQNSNIQTRLRIFGILKLNFGFYLCFGFCALEFNILLVARNICLWLLALFALIGCSTLSSERPKTNQSEGQAIYYSKCGGCHKIYDREKFTPAHWETELVDMKKRAKLTDEQEKKVLLYLTETQLSKSP